MGTAHSVATQLAGDSGAWETAQDPTSTPAIMSYRALGKSLHLSKPQFFHL